MGDLRDELIQAAAVVVSIVEDLDEGYADTNGSSSRPLFTTRTDAVLSDIAVERGKQDGKWGPKHQAFPMWITKLIEEIGEAAQAFLEAVDE